ncbi:hypothetical protein V5O48_005301 [Marasmius crinis-equi]|uniref:F-box domain-containing protein n=1 Tax=Marasmius crinis-equi TaxID=585013 RepID=A0ABR3FMM0_9AGAR
MSDAPFSGDDGFLHIAELLTRPGITKADLSMDAFVDLLNAFEAMNHSFSESLVSLDVCDPTFQLTDDEIWQEDWCNFIRRSLKRCAPTLKYLRIWTTAHPPDRVPALQLPSLVEYIGPHEILVSLKLSSAITTIWVPASVVRCSSVFKLSERLDEHLQHTNLRVLSVLRWSVSDTSIESIFRLFPGLEEVSVQPSSPLSKVSSDDSFYEFVHSVNLV